MDIEYQPVSSWIKLRYQFVHGGTRMGNYTAWDIIRFFDEGQITEDTVIVICSPTIEAGYDKPSRFADTRLYKAKDELRTLASPLGQVMMINELTRIRSSLVGISLAIGILGFVYLVFGFIPTLAR
jgi:hypothetical protein